MFRSYMKLMNVVAAHQGESVVPLLAKGFRPFFLLASVFAATILPVWLLTLFGIVHPGVHFDGVAWHAHEMVFGFAGAVIAGFLLTAVSNWTGRETLTGPGLAGLALLWVAGRVAQLAPVPEALVAVVDLSFLPALAVAVGRPLLLAHNRKNFVMVVALVGLWAADLMVYSPAWRQRGLALGVDLVVLLIVIFSGRVFPMFTRNGTGNSSVRSVPVLTRIPLLWILHAAYAFIPIGFALRAASLWGAAVPPSAATHALTVGAIGCSTLGMMARVALGHTGRMLAVGRPVATAFGLLVIAAVVRTAGPLLPVVYTTSLVVAGTLWALAFGTYAVVYAPIVMGPRIDGKPG